MESQAAELAATAGVYEYKSANHNAENGKQPGKSRR